MATGLHLGHGLGEIYTAQSSKHSHALSKVTSEDYWCGQVVNSWTFPGWLSPWPSHKVPSALINLTVCAGDVCVCIPCVCAVLFVLLGVRKGKICAWVFVRDSCKVLININFEGLLYSCDVGTLPSISLSTVISGNISSPSTIKHSIIFRKRHFLAFVNAIFWQGYQADHY